MDGNTEDLQKFVPQVHFGACEKNSVNSTQQRSSMIKY